LKLLNGMSNIYKVLITGGSGFIGSALTRQFLEIKNSKILNIDKLSYASDLKSLQAFRGFKNYTFVKGNICDELLVARVINEFKPQYVMHLAAESHVDRSIKNPSQFLSSNIFGTFSILNASLEFWRTLDKANQRFFRFHHISTDEVYGSLGKKGLFTESSPYDPSSPYSASKAASDHLVRAWHRTYGLPIIITNCSNNYGPYQYPEKLIPVTILNAIHGKNIPIYGDGSQIRDWLYVDDHAKALIKTVSEGAVGETYNIGGKNEISNLTLVKHICSILDEKVKIKPKGIASFHELITFVDDRLGHDSRYAIDNSKISNDLSWKPGVDFNHGIRNTIDWYLDNQSWFNDFA
jgi:dTDP-glucose 4,6-dehydratase